MRVGQMLEGGGGSADPPPPLLFPPAFTCLLFFFILLFATMPHVGGIGSRGIDCFKCVSVNGDNPGCEDPFHNNYTKDMLQSPCFAGRKDRNGLFPATACIKLAGYYDESGESIVVRSCALDSGTLTTDTEIIRMSHCGGIYLDGKYVKGCLQSCDDYEGCNSSPPGPSSSSSPFLVLLLLLSHLLLHHHRSS